MKTLLLSVVYTSNYEVNSVTVVGNSDLRRREVTIGSVFHEYLVPYAIKRLSH